MFFFLLHNCAQYKAILKIQLNQRLREDFLQGFYILIRLIYRLNIVFIYLLIYLFVAMSIAVPVIHVVAVVDNGKNERKI